MFETIFFRYESICKSLSPQSSKIIHLLTEIGEWPKRFYRAKHKMFNSLGVLPDMNKSLTLARGAKELGTTGSDRSSATI